MKLQLFIVERGPVGEGAQLLYEVTSDMEKMNRS